MHGQPLPPVQLLYLATVEYKFLKTVYWQPAERLHNLPSLVLPDSTGSKMPLIKLQGLCSLWIALTQPFHTSLYAIAQLLLVMLLPAGHLDTISLPTSQPDSLRLRGDRLIS